MNKPASTRRGGDRWFSYPHFLLAHPMKQHSQISRNSWKYRLADPSKRKPWNKHIYWWNRRNQGRDSYIYKFEGNSEKHSAPKWATVILDRRLFLGNHENWRTHEKEAFAIVKMFEKLDYNMCGLNRVRTYKDHKISLYVLALLASYPNSL